MLLEALLQMSGRLSNIAQITLNMLFYIQHCFEAYQVQVQSIRHWKKIIKSSTNNTAKKTDAQGLPEDV